MKAAKTLQNLKEMPYPPQKNKNKKKLLKRKGNSITPVKTNAPISDFFRMPKINNSNSLNESKDLNNQASTTSRRNKSIFAS